MIQRIKKDRPVIGKKCFKNAFNLHIKEIIVFLIFINVIRKLLANSDNFIRIIGSFDRCDMYLKSLLKQFSKKWLPPILFNKSTLFQVKTSIMLKCQKYQKLFRSSAKSGFLVRKGERRVAN